MKTFFALSLLFPLSVNLAYAGEFDSVYNAMAIPTNAVQTNNSWDDIRKIKGVKWQWGLNQVADHDYTMSGKIPLKFKQRPHHYINPTSVFVTGMRSMIQSIEISADDENNELDRDTLFSNVTYTKIPTNCDITGSALDSSEFYKVEKTGYKPMYLNYGYSRGTHDGSYFAKLNYELDC